MLNRLFGYAYHFRLFTKRIKRRNEQVYYLLKWVLLGALVHLIFVQPLLN